MEVQGEESDGERGDDADDEGGAAEWGIHALKQFSTKCGCSRVVNCVLCRDVFVFDAIILFYNRLHVCFKCV